MLTATHITLRRGGKTLVEGLSLEVGAGELILLTGPNGAGKTTLLRALAGFCPLAGGALTRTVAFCFVGSVPAVKDTLTVAEHQRLWTQLYQEKARSAPNIPLPLPLADALGKTLSSGQKQRLHLSRLWLSQAPLWLIDEPLNALDSAATAALTDGLAQHLAAGGAAVVASHQALALTPARQMRLEPLEAQTADIALSEDRLAAW